MTKLDEMMTGSTIPMTGNGVATACPSLDLLTMTSIRARLLPCFAGGLLKVIAQALERILEIRAMKEYCSRLAEHCEAGAFTAPPNRSLGRLWWEYQC